MSIGVDIVALAGELEHYGINAFVLTNGDDGRPHITHVPLRLAGGSFRCDVGKRTAANVRSIGKVALLWPPAEKGGFSLIVDADATVDGSALVLTPTRAVKHRPAPTAGDGPAANDCQPIGPTK